MTHLEQDAGEDEEAPGRKGIWSLACSLGWMCKLFKF
jgi:hypothetical protein